MDWSSAEVHGVVRWWGKVVVADVGVAGGFAFCREKPSGEEGM